MFPPYKDNNPEGALKVNVSIELVVFGTGYVVGSFIYCQILRVDRFSTG